MIMLRSFCFIFSLVTFFAIYGHEHQAESGSGSGFESAGGDVRCSSCDCCDEGCNCYDCDRCTHTRCECCEDYDSCECKDCSYCTPGNGDSDRKIHKRQMSRGCGCPMCWSGCQCGDCDDCTPLYC